MKTWHSILLGTLLGLLCSAAIYLIAVTPKGTPIVLEPAPTPGPLVIHISGAVHQPGVYALPRGSRVSDAISAAGGALDTADADLINLALQIGDGDRINVPVEGEVSAVPMLLPMGSGSVQESTASMPININTASQTELESLPGIGETRAQDIIRYRETNGAFQSIEDLQKVAGIGAATFDRLRSLISTD
jgi:competence protein ComEA